MTRERIFERMAALAPDAFEELLFRLRVPASVLSPAAQTIRAIEVIRLLEQQERLTDAQPLLGEGVLPTCVPRTQPRVIHRGRNEIVIRVPISPRYTPSGPLDAGLDWLPELLRAEGPVRVELDGAQAGPIELALCACIDQIVGSIEGTPRLALVLGTPTPDPARWPTQGLYADVGLDQPRMIAPATRHPDELLMMWLVPLAFRVGRLHEVETRLAALPAAARSRLDELRERYWPASLPGNELAHGFQPQDPGRLEIPPLGEELVLALLASQVRTGGSSLLAAEDAFLQEDFNKLGRHIAELEGGPPLDAEGRAALHLLRAAQAAVCGQPADAGTYLATLDNRALPDPLASLLALFLAREGDVAAARMILEQCAASSSSPAAGIIRQAIGLCADAMEGDGRKSRRQPWLDACQLLEEEAALAEGVPWQLWICLGQAALQLGERDVARRLLERARAAPSTSIDRLHLSALLDLHEILKDRREHPDRSWEHLGRGAAARCASQLAAAIALAQGQGRHQALGALWQNLGVAEHLAAEAAIDEERRRRFEDSGRAFLHAAEHHGEAWELTARAAHAFLLAGQPQSAGLLFDSIPEDARDNMALSNQAAAFLMCGRSLEALELITRLLKDGATPWQTLANTGIVLLVTGQPDWAVRALESACAFAGPGRWRVEQLLGRALIKANEPRRAQRVLRSAIESHSFGPYLYADHLRAFQAATVAPFRALLNEVRQAFVKMQADTKAVDALDRELDNALTTYEHTVQHHGRKKARVGALLTRLFAPALEAADRMTALFAALEETFAARRHWSAHALVDQIRDLCRSPAGISTSAAPSESESASAPPEWDRRKPVVQAIFAGIAAPTLWEERSVHILSQLIAGSAGSRDGRAHWLQLAARAMERETTVPLRCYHAVDGVEEKGFQRRTVLRVFATLHGRAILADEVGLGKTVEAGLILTEYRLRHMVRSCLILVPSADLARQWLDELTGKFRHTAGGGPAGAAIVGTSAWQGWEQHATCIVTYRAAARLADELRLRTWDMVIADEAAHLHNRGSQAYKLVARLRTRHILLLTATPYQKGVDDLYSLCSLVRPTLFGTLKRFRAEHGRSSLELPRNAARLERLLAQVMVRNTISSVAGELSTGRRDFQNPSIGLSPLEMNFYLGVIEFVLAEAHGANATSLPLTYYLLAREATSSPAAALSTLQRMREQQKNQGDGGSLVQLEKLAVEIPHSTKVEILRQIAATVAPQKVLVFVEFRETARDIGRQLGAMVVHGGLEPAERSRRLSAFRDRSEARILIVTPGLSEGLNLQFCSVLVNYDLPWNPMRIEQRIGRIQRLGQVHKSVRIYSLAAAATIEETIRDGLVRKLRIFEQVIGRVSLSLDSVGGSRGLEVCIREILRQASDEPSLRAELQRVFTKEAEAFVARADLGSERLGGATWLAAPSQRSARRRS